MIKRECIFPGKGGESLSDEVRGALRALARSELFIILLDAGPEGPAPSSASIARSAAALEAAGGRVDAVVWCPHPAGHGCGCWSGHPGLILEAARRFDLECNECYLIGVSQQDMEMAAAAGVRPLLYLQGRTIREVLGDRSVHKDFPVARQLTQAVEYILAEEQTSAQLGRPRQAVPPPPPEEPRLPLAGVPMVTPLSRNAIAAHRRVRLRPRELARWLGLLIVGGVWLSLGIAYLLTHIYRVQPLPDVAWYITLQFIPRVVRGVLFILTGVAVVLLASRSFFHAFGNGASRARR